MFFLGIWIFGFGFFLVHEPNAKTEKNKNKTNLIVAAATVCKEPHFRRTEGQELLYIHDQKFLQVWQRMIYLQEMEFMVDLTCMSTQII